MRKVFLSGMPMQPKLDSAEYSSTLYGKSTPTGFPITIVIENECEPGDEVLVLSLLTEGEENNSYKHYTAFKECVENLLAAKGIKYNFQKIDISVRQDEADHERVIQEIIDYISDGDTVFADVTYGFKTAPIVVLTALTCAKQLKKDVFVDTIVYGRYFDGNHVKDPRLIDVSPLFYRGMLTMLLGGIPGETGKNEIINSLIK